MDPLDKQTFIQQKVVENRDDPAGAKIYWSRHAVVEMVNDGLARSEVEEALAQCQVIEDYPTTHRPLPDCLVLGKLAGDFPVHSVVAIDEVNDRIFIVTVYRPSAERWKMTGELESNICPVCGGPLYSGIATIPYILDSDVVIVIRSVPAEICSNCHEPFTASKVTDEIMRLLNQLKSLQSEVSIVSYPEYSMA